MNISSTTFFKLDKTAHFSALKPKAQETKGLTASGATDNLLPTPAIPTKIKVASSTKIDATKIEQPITPLYESPTQQVRSMLARMRDLADKAASGSSKLNNEQLNKEFQELFGKVVGMLKSGSVSAAALTPAGAEGTNPMQFIIDAMRQNNLLGGKRPNILTEGDAKQSYSSLGMVLHAIDNRPPVLTGSNGPIFPVDEIATATPTPPIIPLYPSPDKWPTATPGEKVEAELIPGSPGSIDDARTKHVIGLFTAHTAQSVAASSVKVEA